MNIPFRNWHFMRLVRLAFGLYLAYQAYDSQQLFFVFFALFFLVQAFFNLGCCGSNGCAVPQKSKPHPEKPLDYEELQ